MPVTPSVDETRVVGRRCVQWLLDRLIVGVPAFLLLVGLVLAVLDDRSLWFLPPIVFLVALLIGGLAVDVWVPYRTGGRTPAMRLLGLRIVTEWGSVPSLGTYALRWLLQVVDGFAFGLTGLIVMVVSSRHQRVGDLVARTLVVRISADAA
ncbi:RDD family protein [Kutzneria buriramensis]|uniref:Putative RDD family membrane protein YckC n=1 Tax=Kutzneria buriramensis TaxID=1045776 RepID=A0A3E0I5H3_9PSEU|nr:RDD family protein [Kutzneria buriramensis]REH53841.1 putative RDD family membrane protein YckC [Kutzneria buriramensis]